MLNLSPHRRLTAGLIVLAAWLWLSLPLAAEGEHQALFKESWGGIYCPASATRVPDQTGTRTLMQTQAGPVTITKSGFGYVFQFPKWSATVQEQVDGSLKIRFGPDTYVFERSKTAFVANLPGDRVNYTLTYGRVTAIHGKAGSVNIRTTFSTNTYTIFGPNGKTRLQLEPRGKAYTVHLLEGEPVEQIPYLVRGYRFEDPLTGVGIYVQVPGGRLTQSLAWSSSAIYKAPVPNPVPVEEAREPDPLQAVSPRKGNSLKAVIGSPQEIKMRPTPEGEDHLKMRPTPEGEDHLKANLGDPEEDPLQVRQHAKPSARSSVKAAPAGFDTPPAGFDEAEEDLILPSGQPVPVEKP